MFSETTRSFDLVAGLTPRDIQWLLNSQYILLSALVLLTCYFLIPKVVEITRAGKGD